MEDQPNFSLAFDLPASSQANKSNENEAQQARFPNSSEQEVLSNSLVNCTTESSSTVTTVRQNINSVVVAHDKNADFLESVFGNNRTVHGNVNFVFNNANPATSGL